MTVLSAEPAAERAGRTPPIRRPTPVSRATSLAGVVAPPLALIILLAVGWNVMAARMDSPLVPSLGAIADELVVLSDSGLLWTNLQVTLTRVLLGFAVAFVVAVVLGIAMGRNKYVQRFFEPAVLLGLVTPGLVKALLCVIWFGISVVNPILAVALAAAPALIVNITQGVRGVDPQLHEMAHVYRFSAWTRLRRIWLPALAPALFTGARLGIAMAWKVIVLVEIFGLASGVGYQLNLEFSNHNVAGVLAWTIAFALVMTAIEYGVLQTLERRVSRWRKESAV
ncbi:ABC transporter permease [Nocardia jinanensis]|uniref:Nitrate ABC transporter permease n=1 Tax=Nocardia jinanensis TaxID=382504 RepID=A0A917RPV4_9NOCA|nr:ABC transporter permease subunit [Nocardia jinanensis]GGL17595.1 nitrate ABC transporter permease [Nocardia jinanensis]